nr:cystathionine gamma-synthase 1, chloroplastic-like [Ipomoea batatas]
MSHFNRRCRSSSSPPSPLPPPIRQRIYSPTPYSPHQCRPLRRRRQSSLHLRCFFFRQISFQLRLQSLQEVKVDHEIVNCRWLHLGEDIISIGRSIPKNAAYLIIRGMKTLHLRVQQQNSTALRMAEVLEIHPKEIIGSACIFIALHRSMTSSWTFNPHATKVYAFHDKLEIRPLCQEM